MLDDFVLELAGAREPRILFLPTASGDPTAQITAFHGRFGDRACRAEHLSLFRLHGSGAAARDRARPGRDLHRRRLDAQPARHLARARARRDPRRRRGSAASSWPASARARCAGSRAGSRARAGRRRRSRASGCCPGSLSVHADGEPERLPGVHRRRSARGALPGGWAADDGVGLLFRGTELERAVSSRPGAGAQRFDAVEGELVRARLEPELLGAGPAGCRCRATTSRSCARCSGSGGRLATVGSGPRVTGKEADDQDGRRGHRRLRHRRQGGRVRPRPREPLRGEDRLPQRLPPRVRGPAQARGA